jgi:hypothetical protein
MQNQGYAEVFFFEWIFGGLTLKGKPTKSHEFTLLTLRVA